MVIVNTVVYVRDHLGGTESDTAVAFAAAGAGSMVVALMLPRLLDRIPDRPFMLAGGVVLTAGLLLGLTEPGLLALLPIWFVLGAGSSLIQTPAGRLLRSSAHEGDRPAIYAAQFALSHACWLIAYPLAGWIGGTLGLTAAFTVLAFVALTSTAAALVLWPAYDPGEQEHLHETLEHEHLHVHEEHHRHEHEGREGPDGEEEPTKYWLSTLPADLDLQEMVRITKLRWRIERDCRELKQEVGLGHFEGRGWRGFHHHATLCIAAYGFLVRERLLFPPSGPIGEPLPTVWHGPKWIEEPALPDGYRPRGAADPQPKARAVLHPDIAHSDRCRCRQENAKMPLLPANDVGAAQGNGVFATQ